MTNHTRNEAQPNDDDMLEHYQLDYTKAKLNRFAGAIGWDEADLFPANEADRSFTLEFWIDDSWYVGRLKEITGVFSQGKTLGELEENIRDAYAMMIDDRSTPSPPDFVFEENLVMPQRPVP